MYTIKDFFLLLLFFNIFFFVVVVVDYERHLIDRSCIDLSLYLLFIRYSLLIREMFALPSFETLDNR